MNGRMIVCALVFAAGCSSAPILPRRPIEVPIGLTIEQVEIAVVSALSGVSQSELAAANEAQPDTHMDKLIQSAYARRLTRAAWNVDSHRPGRLVATHRRGSRSLSIGIRYNQYEVATEILGSERLDHYDGRIHENALVWVSQLENRIDHALKSAAFLGQPSTR